MGFSRLVDFFIHPRYFEDTLTLRKARLFVRATLLTSLFSNSYLWLSVLFEYQLGVYLMIFNVIGFLVLAFLVKTRIPLIVISNLYVLVGAVAVVALTYYSGGVWSAIYPWIISIPVLALLVVNRTYGILWGIISFLIMLWFGWKELQGFSFPVEYNVDLKSQWYVSVLPGLLLIILVISLVFESAQTRALIELQDQNKLLADQKQTIASQAKELKKLIEDKDHIIRILAHDLKNPLANITTISSILKEEKEADQQKKFIAMIEKVSEQAQNLVNKVLDMAVLEQGGVRMKPDVLRMSDVLNEVVEDMKEMAKRKEIELVLEEVKEDLVVKADKTYLMLIFENLISNAIKFSERGKQVTLVTDVHDKNVHVKVMDEGPGIRPEEESKLFEKFSRLSAQPTEGESSSGLGLSLVKKYAEEMGANVWYDRTASKGAAFVVDLPLLQ